ncbi:caspase family protein [Bradyrhizobium sp. WSM2254]|uniref:caspase family protein n=1 Tax=Bradyrhizobium sp. WSM2254 TaxID=1188263 RepID=UPI0004850AB2|nr:caspase family protein [Bradyrhizobium sp. WSM2254]
MATSVAHGLVDREEVKVFGLDACDTVDGSFYVTRVGPRQFTLYLDKQRAEPLTVQSSRPVWVRRPRYEDYAIVVGINRYKGFDPLGGAETDAQAFARWLLSGEGGCLPAANVTKILSSGTDQPPVHRPNFSDVHSAFHPYSAKAWAALDRRVGRRLYIFLSGHGITPTRAATPIMENAALLMADAVRTDMQHLSGHGYAEWFRTAGAFDEIVLFADCCRDQKNNIVPNAPSFPILEGDHDRVQVFYAAATGLGSKAYERRLGEPPAVRGIFSFVLMQALERGAARDADGRLTASTLMNHIENGVQLLKPEQRPRFLHAARPDIVFFDGPAQEPPNVTLSFSARYHGTTVKLFGSNYPQHDRVFDAGPDPVSVRLRLGLYKLKADDGSSRFFEIDVGRVEHVKF